MKRKVALFLVIAGLGIMFAGPMCETRGYVETEAGKQWILVKQAKTCADLDVIKLELLLKAKNFQRPGSDMHTEWEYRISETKQKERDLCGLS